MKMVDKHGVTRWTGPWKGRVVDINDPDRRFRVRAFVVDVLGSTVTGWLLPSLPPGISLAPSLGDQVWCDFEQGDVDKGRWSGTMPTSSEGSIPAPPTVLGDDDETTAVLFGKGGGAVYIDDEDAEGGVRTILEPLTTTQSTYPNVRSLRVGANYIEVDGTPGQERIQMYHQSGSYYEIGSGGQIKRKGQGSEQDWLLGSRARITTGQITDIIQGGLQTKITKSRVTQILGADTTVVTGSVTRTAGTLLETVEGGVTQNANGVRNLSSGGVVDVSTAGRNESTSGNKAVIVTGAVDLAIANTDFTEGQTVGYGVTVALGDIKFEVTTGDFELKTGNAYSLDIGEDMTIAVGGDMSLESEGDAEVVGGSSYLKASDGSIALGVTGKSELLDILDRIVTNLAAPTPTLMGPQNPGGPPGLTALLKIQAELKAIM